MTDFVQARNLERVEEVKDFLHIITHWMVVPIYMGFWLCDLIYVPHLKWEFLAYRSMIIPVCLIVKVLIDRMKTFAQIQNLGLAYATSVAFFISLMIYRIGDLGSPYYAGLMLVAIGSLSFIAWSWFYYGLVCAGIFLPYVAFAGYAVYTGEPWNAVAINSFFILGTMFICFFVRYFNEHLRKKELESRLNLQTEIENRGKIIEEKTQEALGLAHLSRQFSPQVVSAIKDKKLKMESGIHRANICAIFIDIVNSTQRVTRIDKDNVDKVISMFMDDTIKVLLKYDITIDKFLGDGVLAFCNDPIKHDDYVQRVVHAALEIRERVDQRQYLYENYWLNDLELCMGIASGFANVGFYGNEKFYHSYTAIGPVINLASRLCSAAEPNQILASFDVIEKLEVGDFEMDYLGKKTLKGFEGDHIKVYSLLGSSNQLSDNKDIVDCSECGKIMHLDTNAKGIMVFKCRSCGHILDDMTAAQAQFQKAS